MSVLGANSVNAVAPVVGRDMSAEAAFSLDVTSYKSLGSIANIDLMAHKVLGEDPVCQYLREMDLVEYKIIQKEHYVAKKAWDLSGSAIKGGVTAAVVGIGLFVFGDIRSFVSNVVIPGGVGLVVGGGFSLSKKYYETFTIEQDRVGRLASKISAISDRISDQESEGNHSREVVQLQIVRDHFIRKLQEFEESRNISMTPTKPPERRVWYINHHTPIGTNYTPSGANYSPNSASAYIWH